MEYIVNAIILKDDKVLTVKRNQQPWRGMYWLPGGHVENDEENIDALKREIKEELGFDIEVKESDFVGRKKM